MRFFSSSNFDKILIHILNLFFLILFKLHHVNFVGLYMIVCIHVNCALGYNQESVQAVVGQVVSRRSGVASVIGNNGNPDSPVVGSAICRTRAHSKLDF